MLRLLISTDSKCQMINAPGSNVVAGSSLYINTSKAFEVIVINHIIMSIV